MRPESTVPSSPMTDLTIQDAKASSDDAIGNTEEHGEKGVTGEADESADAVADTEDLDSKSKALMHLLQTSNVSHSLCLTFHL